MLWRQRFQRPRVSESVFRLPFEGAAFWHLRGGEEERLLKAKAARLACTSTCKRRSDITSTIGAGVHCDRGCRVSFAVELIAVAAALGIVVTAALLIRVVARAAAVRAELESLRQQLGTAAEARAREESVAVSRRELTRFIVHDLRTPVSGIVALSEALMDGVSVDPERHQRRIRELAGDLAGMVDDLEELERIGAGIRELDTAPVPLGELAGEVVADHRLAYPERIITLSFGAEATVAGDARDLRRAVGNLLRNALEHTTGPVRVDVTSADGHAAVAIGDTGSGIPDDQLEQIFEAGWRVAPEMASGSGLGLAIARGIARAHGGDVIATNQEGGCRFELRVPIVADPVRGLTEMSRNGHGAIQPGSDPEPLSPTGIHQT